MHLLLAFWACCSQTDSSATVTCAWRGPQPPGEYAHFTLSLAKDHQEIENQYITNSGLYARVLQYLNYDIAQDTFLSIPGRPDSVAAIAASYPRQYGSTGHSSVLLVFPVPAKQLRRGCHVTFRGNKFAVGTQRYFFTAPDLQAARQGPPVRK